MSVLIGDVFSFSFSLAGITLLCTSPKACGYLDASPLCRLPRDLCVHNRKMRVSQTSVLHVRSSHRDTT